MIIQKLLLLPILILQTHAFAPSLVSSPKLTSTQLYSMVPASDNPLDQFIDGIKTRVRIAQDSNAAGNSGKQVFADVIAGDYDSAPIVEKIESLASSAPCVMFTWESSPSCKQAVEAFKTMGAEVKICRLDDPWSEGNIMRAELGKKVGRTSVPFVFINGKYVGGFDGGTGNDAPGLVDLAFRGSLRPMLAKAGAMMLD
mmetsp:Transcript_15958/g.23347  ORF Transcript_15958/g.23347 Transcript_15958/m.23347 type:complete len:199 (+) Transcript_15958:114-710(+)|eukprot:CAMPEP_0197238362 /NCGR_PEP_ID=MMETSP1429-20130617/4845_1 /TAXON_ID=49237 /ORGANISM="Chaetoceros  sp., Strain UNC1202" /LENGTH=198 /DNA_ID=CAMNT_0042697489 /DNA_START=79 /DNA_END=675 /DNA_ORIENTATION=+